MMIQSVGLMAWHISVIEENVMIEFRVKTLIATEMGEGLLIE